MNADLFFDALNDIHDRYVTEALTYRASSKRILRPIIRGLAAACLAVIIGFSAILVISAEAREIVFGWIREQVGDFSYYTYENPPADTETEPITETESADYEMTLVPEGYCLYDHSTSPGITNDVYADAEGRMLVFTYRDIIESLKTIIIHDNATIHSTHVHDFDAEIYLANDPDAESSAIVWNDGVHLFSIKGFFDRESLIELAESVAVRPKEYALGCIPEGYVLLRHDTMPNYSSCTYADYEANRALHFSYSSKSDGLLVVIEHENCTHSTVTVRGTEADLYLPDDPDASSASVLWFEGEYMMYIQGFFSEEEIIHLAESVTEVPYSPEPTWQSTYGDQQGK